MTSMHFLYVDEAGCPGALDRNNPMIQPVLSLVGLILPHESLKFITDEFLDLKQQFYSRSYRIRHTLDWILCEIKGSDLSKSIRSDNQTEMEHNLLFISLVLNLIKQYEGRIIGKIYVKPIDGKFDGVAAYTSACQDLHSMFQLFLESKDSRGVTIMDSRTQRQNKVVSHSIFTEKFRYQGDKYPRILEMPLFGESDNHAGIQIADLINSALIYPMIVIKFCDKRIEHPHLDNRFLRLWDSYEESLAELQVLFTDQSDLDYNGIKVIDITREVSSLFCFRTELD